MVTSTPTPAPWSSRFRSCPSLGVTILPPPCGEPLLSGSRDFPRGQGRVGVSLQQRNPIQKGAVSISSKWISVIGDRGVLPLR